MTLQEILGWNLRAVRKARGYSQARLAEIAKVSEQMVGQVERAETWPSPEMLDKLAGALELEAVDLFAREPPVAAVGERERLLLHLNRRISRLDKMDLGKVEVAIRIALNERLL